MPLILSNIQPPQQAYVVLDLRNQQEYIVLDVEEEVDNITLRYEMRPPRDREQWNRKSHEDFLDMLGDVLGDQPRFGLCTHTGFNIFNLKPLIPLLKGVGITEIEPSMVLNAVPSYDPHYAPKRVYIQTDGQLLRRKWGFGRGNDPLTNIPFNREWINEKILPTYETVLNEKGLNNRYPAVSNFMSRSVKSGRDNPDLFDENKGTFKSYAHFLAALQTQAITEQAEGYQVELSDFGYGVDDKHLKDHSNQQVMYVQMFRKAYKGMAKYLRNKFETKFNGQGGPSLIVAPFTAKFEGQGAAVTISPIDPASYLLAGLLNTHNQEVLV